MPWFAAHPKPTPLFPPICNGHLRSASSSDMCKEMNAPVLPESKKLHVSVTNTITLTGKYSFLFDKEFTEAIQMNQRKHACLCRPTKPMMHFCCPGCLEGRYTPVEEDQIDYQRVLQGYNFDEQDPIKAVDQILNLMAHTMPLTLYSYGRGHQAATGKLGTPTLFFANIESVHLWAGHILHACEDYYYHEEYLHTLYHGSILDFDWSPIKAVHESFGHLQAKRNRLYNRVMMSYLGGGVGVGYVEPRTQEMLEFLEQDRAVEAAHGVFSVYLASKNDGSQGEYVAKRFRLIPHGAVVGKLVKCDDEI